MMRGLLKVSCALVQSGSLAVAGEVINLPMRSLPGFKMATVLVFCLVAAAASAVGGALAPSKPVN